MPRRRHTARADQLADFLGRTVVRVAELEELGLHRATISRRCRPGGPWRSLAPGVVSLLNAPPTRADRRRGGLLYAGPGALLTGLDALDIAGMRRIRSPHGPVHLLVPADRRRVGNELAIVERTSRMPTRTPGEWPIAPPARAVLDFARRCRDRDQVRAGLAEVVQSNRATPADLAAEISAGSQRGTALARSVLNEIGDGVRSAAEARAHELLGRERLPSAMWNPRLYTDLGRFVGTPDAWFDHVGLAWEIDSREWHLSPADYDRTVDRHAAMTAVGITVLHTRPSQLINSAPLVLRNLRDSLEQAACRPRPRIRAVPQPALAADGTSGA